MSTTDLSTHTCTVGPRADTGERCGKPAVCSFVGRNGVTYYECADHAFPMTTAASSDDLRSGDKVVIRHAGVDKIGTVLDARKSLCDVMVPTYGGKDFRIVRNVRIDSLDRA